MSLDFHILHVLHVNKSFDIDMNIRNAQKQLSTKFQLKRIYSKIAF